MTICIAAICRGFGDSPYVIGATDRKVTAGDVQFEPPTPKVWPIGFGIAALIAGDTNAQNEICMAVERQAPRSVQEAVNLYCRQLGEYNLRQAERRCLFPLGTTMAGFLMDEHLSPDIAHSLRHDINHERAEIQTIICGVDAFGPSIYKIEQDGRAYCNNSIGFVAIGDGEWHASSQFMFAKYTPRLSLARAMLLLYTAKKRAEVAPGVGETTDIFFIGAGGGVSELNERFKESLDAAFLNVKNAQDRALEDANTSIEQYVEALGNNTSPETSPERAAPDAQSP